MDHDLCYVYRNDGNKDGFYIVTNGYVSTTENAYKYFNVSLPEYEKILLKYNGDKKIVGYRDGDKRNLYMYSFKNRQDVENCLVLLKLLKKE
jgi:hypothetical protein